MAAAGLERRLHLPPPPLLPRPLLLQLLAALSLAALLLVACWVRLGEPVA